MKKEAFGTFGPPIESLRKDPARFLKRGTDPSPEEENKDKKHCASLPSPFKYPGGRYADLGTGRTAKLRLLRPATQIIHIPKQHRKGLRT